MIRRFQFLTVVVLLITVIGVHAQVKVAIYPDSYGSHRIKEVLDTQEDIDATVLSTYNSEVLANYDVLMNIRGQNLDQNAVIEFIRNGGTWIGEWFTNSYPINNWGLISSDGFSGNYGCCTQELEIIDQNHHLVQNVEWDNLPLNINSTQYMRDLRVINDPMANVIVKAGKEGVADNPLLVEKQVGLGRIILLNWDYSDQPSESAYIADLVQEMVRRGGMENIDVLAPVLSGVPANLTLDCNNIPAPAVVTAIDDTDGNVSVVFNEVRQNGSCANSYILTRTWTATDASGNTALASQIISVEDKSAPILSGVPQATVKVQNVSGDGVSCGAIVALPDISAADHCGGDVVIEYSINGAPVSFSNEIFPVGDTEVTVEATDVCGNTATSSFTVSVTDSEAPVIVLKTFASGLNSNGELLINEGNLVESITDNCGVASVILDKTLLNCENIGNNEIFITATDVNGNVSTASTIVTVFNDTPTLEGLTLSGNPVNVFSSVSVAATFNDDNLNFAEISWGDGTVSEGEIHEDQIKGSHQYHESGIYSIAIKIYDACGLTAYVEDKVIVIDTNGGFITGGGWINSQPGAYPASPALEGKANFGFVAKYNDSNYPLGNVNFNFKNANLKFHSTSLEWLVVSGETAVLQGQGRINGQGDYGFVMSVVADNHKGKNSSDAFRIRIWDLSNDNVIYDNELTNDVYAEAGTVVSGGSIKIHTRGRSAERIAENNVSELEVELFPNPATTGLNVQVFNDSSSDKLSYTVYDLNGNIVKNLSDVSTTSIDVADLNAGVYMLVIESEAGIKRERFIKKNF